MAAWVDYFDTIDPVRWGTITGGSGSVTVASNVVTIDPGGTAAADVAAMYLKTPLDLTKRFHMLVKVRLVQNVSPGSSNPPRIVSVVDESAEPTAEPIGTLESNERIAHWNRHNVSTNWQGGIWAMCRNSAGTGFNGWNASSNTWTTISSESWEGPGKGELWFIVKHDPTDGFRLMGCGGHAEGENVRNSQGLSLFLDTDWRALGSEMAGVTNDAYLVIGHRATSGTKNNVAYEVLAAHYCDLDTADDQICWINAAPSSGGSAPSFPRQYEIQRLEVGARDLVPLFLPVEPTWKNYEVERGDVGGQWDWVKDPMVVKDGATGTYYMLVSVFDNSGSVGEVHVAKASSLGAVGSTFTTWTRLMSSADVNALGDTSNGHSKAHFPSFEYDGTTWTLFFSTEGAADAEFSFWYSQWTGTDPTTGTFSLTSAAVNRIVETTGGWRGRMGLGRHYFDSSNPTNPHRLFIAGQTTSSSRWQTGVLESPNLTGPYTELAGQPIVKNNLAVTQLSGAASKTRTFNVANASQFSVGDPTQFDVASGTIHPNHITDIAGNTITLACAISFNNGRDFVHATRGSVYLTDLHLRDDNVWVAECTFFRFGSAEFAGFAYNANADPTTDNWTYRDPSGTKQFDVWHPQIPNYANFFRARDEYWSWENPKCVLVLNEATGPIEIQGEAVAEGTAAMAAFMELPIAGDAIAEGAATIASFMELPIAGDAIAEGTTSIVSFGVAVIDGDAIAEGVSTFDVVGTAVIAGDAIAEGAATIASFVETPIAGDATAEGDGQMVNFLAVSITGEAIAEGTALLNIVGTSAISGDAVAEGAATADILAVVEIAGEAVAEGFAILNVLGTTAILGNALAEGATTADMFGAVDVGGNAIAEGFPFFDVRGTTAIFGGAFAEGIASMVVVPPPTDIPIAGDAVAEGFAIFDVLETFAIFGEAIAEGGSLADIYATVVIGGSSFAQGVGRMAAIGPTPPPDIRMLHVPARTMDVFVPAELRTVFVREPQ